MTALVRELLTRLTRFIKHDNPLVDWMIIAIDMEQAELDWVTDCQKQLADETNFELWKHQLELFVDDNNYCLEMWRQAEESEHSVWTEVRILLLKQHPLTTLFVKFAHEPTLHNGVEDTLTELRSKYWLVKGRQFIRKLIRQCVVCC